MPMLLYGNGMISGATSMPSNIQFGGTVGIGSVPSYKLDVQNNTNGLARFMFSNSDTTTWQQTDLAIGRGGSSNFLYIGTNYLNTQQSFIDDRSGGYLSFKNSGTETMRIDSSGRVMMPLQPAFHSYRTTNWTTGSANITGWTQNVNVGNYFNNSTGTFTAPVAGTYSFFFSSIGNSNSAQDVYLYVNGSKRADALSVRPDSSNNTAFAPMGASFGMVYLNAADYVNIWTNGTLYSDSNVWIRFGGYLLG